VVYLGVTAMNSYVEAMKTLKKRIEILEEGGLKDGKD
jgi:prefoldin subunit 5